MKFYQSDSLLGLESCTDYFEVITGIINRFEMNHKLAFIQLIGLQELVRIASSCSLTSGLHINYIFTTLTRKI